MFFLMSSSRPFQYLPISWFGGYLRNLGQCYTEAQLHASELRVLDTLDYKIPSLTPADFIETLITLLG